MRFIVTYFIQSWEPMIYLIWSLFYGIYDIINFSLMLKKVPNIPNYSVFNCFAFLFQSKKISYDYNCVVICFFFSLKKFLKYLIMFSTIFFIFFEPWTFHHYMFWKRKYMQVYYTPQKSFEDTIFRVIQVILSNTEIFWII